VGNLLTTLKRKAYLGGFFITTVKFIIISDKKKEGLHGISSE
jgi:hypothetical protein